MYKEGGRGGGGGDVRLKNQSGLSGSGGRSGAEGVGSCQVAPDPTIRLQNKCPQTITGHVSMVMITGLLFVRAGYSVALPPLTWLTVHSLKMCIHGF